ncbi:magnesium transporter [Azospirillum halopraeferens]|uniref:magnesium transporter n=1 Tax=Azospirillum halopraeferens TaxID=34010 RepID=UPI00048E222A|nr:magnesium transporter [Azospirillum halopraeferens]
MHENVFTNRDILPAALDGSAVDYRLLHRAVQDCLAKGDRDSVTAFFEEQHPADTANFLGGLEQQEICAILRVLPLDVRAEVFGYFPDALQGDLARCLGRAELAELVGEMSADERADLFNRLSEEQREALLPALAQAEREDIRRLAGYAEGTVGAVMTSEYATLAPDLTARAAIDKLRLEAPAKETIYRAYVIDADRRLVGAVRLADLILAGPEERVEALMERATHAVRVDDDQEVAARRIARYDVLALPVVDADGRIVGIVTHDDAMDVAEQEATEDFHKHGTVANLTTSLKDATIALLYRKRVFWLVILVFGNLFSGAGIAAFEDLIAANVALVFFLPLLIDSGGNAGSQSATLMVRALATGDVHLRDWGRMLGREAMVAGLLGLTMAVAVSAIGLVRGGPEIALIVSTTMVIIVLVGSLVGMSLPFLLSRFKLDPASASAPLITSISDASGVLIYFAIATTVLPAATGA